MRIIGLAGWSGAGKTSLIKRLLPLLVSRGLTVSTVKHAHHRFDIDHPGKDSFAHREAGAKEVLIVSGERFALMHELRGAPEPDLEHLLSRMSPVDLVIVEGFKQAPYPKIEIYRRENGKAYLYPEDSLIGAVATDEPQAVLGRTAIPLDDTAAIAQQIMADAASIEQVISALRAGSVAPE